MTDRRTHVKGLRDRAKECATIAGAITDEQARERYLKLAEAYEIIALQEEVLERIEICISPGRIPENPA